jgi:hypothetical protein
MKPDNKFFIFLLLSITVLIFSCTKPRIEFNRTVWGDNAVITSAVIFKNVEVTNQLGYNAPVTGYQSVAIATPTNTVDKSTYTVTIVAAKGTDLKAIGVRFTHFADFITPVNKAPAAGVISDFSAGNFVYRLTSADGTTRDWKVLISVAP